LNVFWVTFIQGGQPASPSSDPDTTKITDMNFSQLSQKLSTLNAPKQVQIQLHWIEYFQGKWSKRISSDVNDYPAVYVDDGFVPEQDVYIHVAKEIDKEGNEGAVLILLDFHQYETASAFRVTSKNCTLILEDYGENMPEFPYNAGGVDGTLVTGTGTLTASFETHIGSSGRGPNDTETILATTNDYALLMCGNHIAPPFLPSTDPLYWEAGNLVSPFFFKDTTNPNVDSQSTFFDELTFFVQPSLTEATMVEWEGWAIAPSTPVQNWADPNVLNNINVVAQFPAAINVPVNPGDPVYSKYSLQTREDWVTNPATAISFGNTYVGKTGGVSVGKTFAFTRGVGFSRAGLAGLAGTKLAGGVAAGGGLVLVGGQGLRLSQLQSVRALQGSAAASNAIALSRQKKF
jgi:hypothetical protein